MDEAARALRGLVNPTDREVAERLAPYLRDECPEFDGQHDLHFVPTPQQLIQARRVKNVEAIRFRYVCGSWEYYGYCTFR